MLARALQEYAQAGASGKSSNGDSCMSSLCNFCRRVHLTWAGPFCPKGYAAAQCTTADTVCVPIGAVKVSVRRSSSSSSSSRQNSGRRADRRAKPVFNIQGLLRSYTGQAKNFRMKPTPVGRKFLQLDTDYSANRIGTVLSSY